MDETEMTVAAFRALYASGKINAAVPTLASADAACNYTTTAGASDKQAVRCVSFTTARAACRARGGDLPTVAQWEHAARGRGRGSRFPWGNAAPMCCSAAIDFADPTCKPSLKVGSHADATACDGAVDVSRDGVLDLAGSVREWVRDAPLSFDDCFSAGILADPTCTAAKSAGGSTKGGSFSLPASEAASALRRTGATISDVGFRCVR
jgi:formylglycine-generating enzyme required for sulfatase activity